MRTSDLERTPLPHTERRRPRESYTRSLIGMCKRLDARHSAEIEHGAALRRFRALRDRAGPSQVSIRRLWVTGSYARGALTCGDLDVLIEAEGRDRPHTKAIVRVLLGSRPGVRVYSGTPTENESGVEFPEAVLVWSDDGADWKARIEAIGPDPTAGRFAREHDVLPLRAEQLDPDTRIDALMSAYKAGHIRWSFHPLGERVRPLESIDDPDEREYEASNRRWLRSNAGRKSQDVLDYLEPFLDDRAVPKTTELRPRYPKRWQCGDAEILVGRPWVSPRELWSLDRARVIVCPHLSSRGPNGFWVIERDDRHPIVMAVQNALARTPVYYVTTDEGGAIEPAWGITGTPILARRIDLFRSPEAAQAYIESWMEVHEDEKAQDPDMEIPTYSVRRIDARPLLSEVAASDEIAIDDGESHHVGSVPMAAGGRRSRHETVFEELGIELPQFPDQGRHPEADDEVS